jgi:hypothetical protein
MRRGDVVGEVALFSEGRIWPGSAGAIPASRPR